MGEAVLGAFLPVLLEKLADREVLEYFGRLKGVDKTVLQKWTRTLTAIEALLSDAEEKQLTQRAVKEWLDDLRDLAYDIQDILDIVDTKMLKRRIERQQGSKSKLWSSLFKAKSNFTLNSEIKKVDYRLEVITTRQKQFDLKNLGVSKKPWKMPPTTSQLDGPVIGRDEAKAKILDNLLLKQETYHVVGIVGTGGLGKTTLAKHLFNDAATEQFSPKGWVSVSDDFDIVRVAAAILESVTKAAVQEFKELNSILEKLSKELAGKKFLIVLDDVWHTCSYDQWTTLQSSFPFGAAGSKVIVTTRDTNVAKMMGDSSPFELKSMSEDDCWKIFEHHALLNNRPEDAEFLKDKIVKKCNGLPLAARTLGGLLRCKRVDEWEDILDHKMWTLSDPNKMDILPALKLSYHYLPSHLKRCFSYCAILPNDYEFREMQLILWWMAEGLIPQQHKENNQMEDFGRDYFQELVSRSLFQKSSKTESLYIMHDLVTDLARWAAGSSCSRLEDMQKYDLQHICLAKVRHSSYVLGEYDGVKKFEVYSGATCLRTFLPLSDPSWNNLAHKVTSDLLPKLQYLRMLSLYGYQITELPDTIGELKHLRYLDLSGAKIKALPDSTTTLYNLQTLLLKKCDQLKALPTNMRNLVNLRHLDNSGTWRLEGMPPHLDQLTNLQTLPEFVVGKGSGSGVREIGSLLHLQGTLHLSRLENVICVEDARSADLKSKKRLEALFLEWSFSSVSTEDDAIVLDRLQPNSKLKELTIEGYAGLKFSSWIGSPLFTKMVRVTLEGCNYCQLLPPFGQLPCLKELCIRKMDAVESVGVEFYGEGNLPPFQALETLEFLNLKNWKKWSPYQQSEGVRVFSCLKMLSIEDCPKLEGDLPEKLDSLAKLDIRGCEELVVSVSKYKQLHESNIGNCKLVVYDTSTVQFDLLERSTFSNISELRFETEAFMKSLKNVKELKITGCEELTCSFQNEDYLLQHLISLGRLYIEDNSALIEKLGKEAEQLVQLQILDCKLERLELSKCGSLLKVPEGLHHLTSLRELRIRSCSSLVSFPDVGLPPCLQVIEIEDCKSLLHFAKYRIPPSLKRIEIKDCESLKSLIEKEEEADGSSSCLEQLKIVNCPSLMCLLRKGQLPRSLKQLVIRSCGQLELITERCLDQTCQLEEIYIFNCPNLKSLPEGLCDLTNLQSLPIDSCQSLVSLPRMNVWPRSITIFNSEKLEVAELVRDMMHANNVEELCINYCEGLTTTTTCFPPNLTSLEIYEIKNCKALMESQGLQRLTSLRRLSLCGENDGSLVSFPPFAENSNEAEILLPTSLVRLDIVGFPNLKKLSEGFRFLTSLESLFINDCPKLKTLPMEEGLPLSLMHIGIVYGCPLLKERYKGRNRHKIAHIPCVAIF